MSPTTPTAKTIQPSPDAPPVEVHTDTTPTRYRVWGSIMRKTTVEKAGRWSAVEITGGFEEETSVEVDLNALQLRVAARTVGQYRKNAETYAKDRQEAAAAKAEPTKTPAFISSN